MRIGLLEDDPDQARLVQRWLGDAGHTCLHAAQGEAFLRLTQRESFDLLLIDWMLPGGLSGIDIMQRIRESGRDYTPVLMVTARDEEADIVAALGAGADDYMVKPLRRNELLARAAALVRTLHAGRDELSLPDTAPYRIDLAGKSISLHGTEVPLTSREYELAVFLFRHAGRAVSRGHLLEAIWGMSDMQVHTRTVDTHMSRLRRKLALGEGNAWQLTAIYQHGYRLENREAAGGPAPERIGPGP